MLPRNNSRDRFRFLGKLWLKVGEDIQLRIERMGDVEIVIVTPAPAKRLAVFNFFEIARTDAAALKYFCSVKSPPTTPTMLTSVKKLAEIEKCEAEPPSIFSHLPKGFRLRRTQPNRQLKGTCVFDDLFGFGCRIVAILLRPAAYGVCLRRTERAQLFRACFAKRTFRIVVD